MVPGGGSHWLVSVTDAADFRDAGEYRTDSEAAVLRAVDIRVAVEV